MAQDIEHQHQVALFDWARMQEGTRPELALLFAVPNGGKRDARTAARLKREGVRAGVPDVWLPVPRGGHPGLVLEMKTETGRVQPEQRVWIERLSAQGHRVLVCRSWDAARDALLEYLDTPPVPSPLEVTPC